MARAKKVDRNQAEIVAALRSAGVQVYLMHMTGGGFPDLITTWKRRTVLLEIKNSPADEVSIGQIEFMALHQGYCRIVSNAQDALLVAQNPEAYAYLSNEQDKLGQLVIRMKTKGQETMVLRQVRRAIQ